MVTGDDECEKLSEWSIGLSRLESPGARMVHTTALCAVDVTFKFDVSITPVVGVRGSSDISLKIRGKLAEVVQQSRHFTEGSGIPLGSEASGKPTHALEVVDQQVLATIIREMGDRGSRRYPVPSDHVSNIRIMRIRHGWQSRTVLTTSHPNRTSKLRWRCVRSGHMKQRSLSYSPNNFSGPS